MAKVKLLVSLFPLVFFHFAKAAEIQASSNDRPHRRSASDPVSNFFSELGDMFLDIDGTIAVKTAPKGEFQDSLASRILGPLQPPKEYFDRIQENYKALQSRLGSIIENAISPKPDRQGRILDRGVENSNVVENMIPEDEEGHWNSRHVSQHSQGRSSSSLGAEVTMEKILSNTRRFGEFLSTLGKPSNDMSSVMVRRRGDVAQSEESDPQGRIIDSLFSESRFDQYIRQLLKNHGGWIFDNPLLKRLRDSRQLPNQETEESSVSPFSETFTEAIAATSTGEAQSTESIHASIESENEIPESFGKVSQPLPFIETNYYKIDDNGKTINEEVDIFFESDPKIASYMESAIEEAEAIEGEVDQEIESRKGEVEEELAQDTLVLAFTPDGVPLKLRFGPEIENPIMYLHKFLRTAGVTLKVPVESYDDLEPVGKEVMLLGSSSVIARAVYLDMSNPQELESFLRTLMISAASGKDRY